MRRLTEHGWAFSFIMSMISKFFSREKFRVQVAVEIRVAWLISVTAEANMMLVTKALPLSLCFRADKLSHDVTNLAFVPKFLGASG